MHSKILLIEQQANLRNQLQDALKEHGYEVISFDQPQKALDWLSIARADLIILEKALPGEDAVTFCRKIRGFKESQQTPIIVLLTLEEMQERGDLKASGASDFLVKPFTALDALEKVEIYLLERAAKGGRPSSAKKSPQKESEGLDTIFGAGIDLDSILKESKNPAEETSAPEADKPAADDLELKIEKMEGNSLFPFDLEPAQEFRPEEDQHDYGWFMDEMKREKELPKKKESKPPTEKPALEAFSGPPSPPAEKPKEKFQTEEMGTSKVNFAEFLKEVTGESEKPAEEPKAKEPELNPQVTMDSKGEFKPKKTAPPPTDRTPLSEKKPTISGLEGMQEPHKIPAVPPADEHLPEPFNKMPEPTRETSEQPPKATQEVDYPKLYAELTDKLASRLAKELVANLDAEKVLKLIKQELEKD